MSDVRKDLGKNFKFFKKFKNIDINSYQNLLKKADEYRIINKANSIYNSITDFIYIYKNNLNKDNFDKICLFLILIFDRDALLYNTFLELITTKIDIYDKDNYKPFVLLQKELTKKQMDTLKTIALNLFSFYDDALLEIEKAYFNKFLLNDNLSISFNTEYFFRILSLKGHQFEGIDEERMNELKDIVSKWFLAYKVKNAHFLLAYQLEKEPNFFGNPSWEEKAIILILAIDPQLKLLKHYMTNCNLNKTAEYSFDLFGFYYHDLIKLEHKYNETYKIIPENPWELMLKSEKF